MLGFFTGVLWHAARSSPSNLALDFYRYVKTFAIAEDINWTVLLDSHSLSWDSSRRGIELNATWLWES